MKELILVESYLCNLNCNYCEINNSIEDNYNNLENIKIRQALLDKTYINNIKNFFNKNQLNPNEIIKISLWGGEPTINLDIFFDFFQDLIIYFPNIKNFQITSNFVNIQNLIIFLSKIEENNIYNHKITIQLSYDGEHQTKINRKISPQIIYDNLQLFNKEKQKWNHLKIFLKINTVLSKEIIHENISVLHEDIIYLLNHFEIDKAQLNIQHPLILSKYDSNYFAQQIFRLHKIIRDPKIQFNFIENLKKNKEEDINKNIANIFYKKNKNSYFTGCGIGKEKITILYNGENIYCHDAIYGKNLNTKNDLRKNQQDTKFFENISNFNQNYDFQILKNTINLMDLLLENNLIDNSYNNKEKLIRHAYLLNKIQQCKEDNIITTGSIYGVDINYIILMCNGLLDIEEFLK